MPAAGRAGSRSALRSMVVGESGFARMRAAAASPRHSFEGRAAPRGRSITDPPADRNVHAMDYFPLFLRLSSEPVLVVGGGDVAARKIELLLRAGAKITVVAPELNRELAAKASAGEIEHVPGEFRP